MLVKDNIVLSKNGHMLFCEELFNAMDLAKEDGFHRGVFQLNGIPSKEAIDEAIEWISDAPKRVIPYMLVIDEEIGFMEPGV